METGFIGIGVMGAPMALNLARSGIALRVWSRSAEKCASLCAIGATLAADPAEVFAHCPTVLLMLADEAATDTVLGRGTPAFAERVARHTIVSMGTSAPAYSHALHDEIRGAGGRYVEAPVSGSRKPAEEAALVAMLAGDQDTIDAVRPIIRAMCRETIDCGAVPSALQMKLAVNLFLITMVTGLAEATHFARAQGLDLNKFAAVLDAGPMASSVSRVKLRKLVDEDLSVQAAIADVLKNNRLVADAARAAALASPLLDTCHALYRETLAMGLASADMIAVVRAIEARSTIAAALSTAAAQPPSAPG